MKEIEKALGLAQRDGGSRYIHYRIGERSSIVVGRVAAVDTHATIVDRRGLEHTIHLDSIAYVGMVA